MTTYVMRDGALVPKQDAPPRKDGPHYWPDIPEYKSPLGTGFVTSRSQRREEMKRHGCREIDPTEFEPAATSERNARRYGLKWPE